MFISAALFSATVGMAAGEQQVKAVRYHGNAQGTTWNVTYYAADSLVARSEIDSILLAIDSSLSLYKPYSTIVAFNESELCVKTDPHIAALIKRKMEI